MYKIWLKTTKHSLTLPRPTLSRTENQTVRPLAHESSNAVNIISFKQKKKKNDVLMILFQINLCFTRI